MIKGQMHANEAERHLSKSCFNEGCEESVRIDVFGNLEREDSDQGWVRLIRTDRLADFRDWLNEMLEEAPD